VRQLSVLAVSLILVGGLSAVPAEAETHSTSPPTDSATSVLPVPAEAGAEPVAAPPDRITAPAAMLGSDWPRSDDRAVTTAGDETGLHVLVADRREAYQWRTVATLAEPMIDTDQWIGQLCVTGSGSRAVVVYAPRTFTNFAIAMEQGAFAAIVDLDTGEVTKLAERTSLAYYNPACGADEVATLSRLERAERLDTETRTWIGVLDTATGEFARSVRAPGQLTSAVPVDGRIFAAGGHWLVEVGADGEFEVVARTNGQPIHLMPDGSRGLAFQVAREHDIDLARLARGSTVETLATVPLGSVKLRPGAGGTVFAIGSRASQRLTAPEPGGIAPDFGQRPAGFPRSWRVVDAAPDSEPSTGGGMVVERARTMREAMGAVDLVDADRARAGTVDIVARLTAGDSVRFTARTLTSAAGRTPSPAWGAAGVAGHRVGDGVGIQSASTTPWDVDPVCAVPRNHPEIQVYQPSPEQVEWAADLAVRGQLTFQRPANWLNNQLPAYSPQGYFPPVSLAGGGHVPAQVLLGVLAQESNLWQASYRVVDAMAGNPLISAGMYALDWENPDPMTIGEGEYDCGYGAAQVTTGMRSADTGTVVNGIVMSYDKQRAVVTDYATNVAAGLRILQQKWNDLHASGLIANNGDPAYIENWFMAVWAYNSGFQPDERFGNTTGCLPSPTCTDAEGNWGVGWSNNPANPIYPADRAMFLTAPLDVPDEDIYDDIAYDNAKHPHHWSYPEKVMGWAYTSLKRYNYHSQSWVDTYWTAQKHAFTEDAQPGRMTFCSLTVNHCDPEADPSQTSAPAPPCLHMAYRCWWNEPVTFAPNDCVNCGTEHRRYTTVEPRPLASSIYSSQCSTTGLPANARIIDDIDYPGPRGPNGCHPNWTKGGSFSLEFEERLNGNSETIYPGKYNFHQIGGGFGGHFWFTHSQKEQDDHLRITGRWTVDPVNAWARVLVHIPDHGARTQQAFYKIHPPAGGAPKHRSISQHLMTHTWVDIGVFDFTGSGTPVIELSNITQDGVGVHNVAWDAIAIQPLPAKPEHFVVALGDSYSSGEGTYNYYPGTYQYHDDGNNEGSYRNECRRSPQTWSRLTTIPNAPATIGALKDSLHADLDYHLVACAGARTHHLLGTEITFPGEPVRMNAFDNLPAGQHGELPQLDRGFLDENTTLVLLNIGGNDAGWTGVLELCIMQSLACHEDPAMDDVLDLITGPLPASVALVMEQIAAAAPNAEIFLMGYPFILDETCHSSVFTSVERAFLNDLTVILADHTVSDHTVYDPTDSFRSRGIRATVVDFSPPCNIFIDHPGQGIWGVRFENPPLYWQGAGDGSFHPTVTGYGHYASLADTYLDAFGYTW
jgi:hypothetical protein